MTLQRCAFFDVDGTIIAHDSFRRLVRRLVALQPWRVIQLPLIGPIFLVVALFARDRRWPKSVLLWALTWGYSRKQSVRLLHRAMQDEWNRLWFLQATPCFADLRENQKCHLVFVSASGQLWIRHLLKTMDGLHPKTIIGSKLGFWFGGIVYTSKNCFGAEKLVRIRERCGDNIDWVAGYSDHAVDIPMLARCKQRIVISPSEKSLKRFEKEFKTDFQLERWQVQTDSKHP